MKENPAIRIIALALIVGGLPCAAQEPNPAIDMKAHLQLAAESAVHRESRLVSESEFIRMSREPGTIILDARSREKFEELHIAGAVNLNFSDFTADALRKLIPSNDTRILIYCNNNFANADDAFPTKAPPVALNLSTYINLYVYGYRNVYELAPLVDVAETSLPLESTR